MNRLQNRGVGINLFQREERQIALDKITEREIRSASGAEYFTRKGGQKWLKTDVIIFREDIHQQSGLSTKGCVKKLAVKKSKYRRKGGRKLQGGRGSRRKNSKKALAYSLGRRKDSRREARLRGLN